MRLNITKNSTEQIIDKGLEYGLPDWLTESINSYEENKDTSLWDCYYCELQSDINVAEQEQMITSEQAWFLREKYLEIQRRSDYDRFN